MAHKTVLFVDICRVIAVRILYHFRKGMLEFRNKDVMNVIAHQAVPHTSTQ